MHIGSPRFPIWYKRLTFVFIILIHWMGEFASPAFGVVELGREEIDAAVGKALSLAGHGAEGFLLYRTAETEEEKARAIALLEPRAEAGDINAILVVAGHYSLYDESPEGRTKSFELYLQGAKQGEPICCFLTGDKYEHGDGVQADAEAA